MVKNIDIFEKAPVPQAVFKLAVPTVLSMIVSVFYNMVDAFFVGLIGDPSQFAAVNVATPVFLFLMAAGNIFGMGGSSYISRSLGRKDFDLVKKIKPDIALVSNHGGRVPQRHGSTAQFLADFHKILLENSGEVWVDGGIRNQDQIQKAFSYGVKEVLIGRPFVSAILKKQKI